MIQRHALRLTSWGLGIAVMLGLAGSPTQAEFIEYTTSVTIDQTPGSYSPGGSTFPTGSQTVMLGAYTQNAPFAGFLTGNGNQVNMIAVSSNPNPPHANTQGPGTDIVFAMIDATSTANTTVVDTIAFNYTFTLNLKDYSAMNSPSGSPDGTASVQFTGRIEGQIGNGLVMLQNLSFATLPANGIITASNGHVFEVTTGGYTSPGLENYGALGAHITLRSVPEPASMAMLGLGGLGAFGLFRRRKAKASA